MEKISKVSIIVTDLITIIVAFLCMQLVAVFMHKTIDSFALSIGCILAGVYWILCRYNVSSALTGDSKNGLFLYLKRNIIKTLILFILLTLIILTQWISPLYFSIGFGLINCVLLAKFTWDIYQESVIQA